MSTATDILFGSNRVSTTQAQRNRIRSRFIERAVAVANDYGAPVSPEYDAAAIRGIFEAATDYVRTAPASERSWFYQALEDDDLPGADGLAVLHGLPPLVAAICFEVKVREEESYISMSVLHQVLLDNGVSKRDTDQTITVLATYLAQVQSLRESH